MANLDPVLFYPDRLRKKGPLALMADEAAAYAKAHRREIDSDDGSESMNVLVTLMGMYVQRIQGCRDAFEGVRTVTTYRCPKCKTDTTRPITGRYGCPSCPPTANPAKLDTSSRTRRTAPVRGCPAIAPGQARVPRSANQSTRRPYPSTTRRSTTNSSHGSGPWRRPAPYPGMPQPSNVRTIARQGLTSGP